MPDTLPTISVIIPVLEERSAAPVLESLRVVDYPSENLEIIVARGKQPSRQRNLAVGIADGELLYFLDNDSIVAPGLFLRAVATLRAHHADVVGGPSATPRNDTLLQRCFGYAFASPFGTLGSRRRYRSIGDVKEATETDLIMCNLCMYRRVFEQATGLDERLYPNEENEFLNRLTRQGVQLVYDPQAIVYRSQSKTWAKFARQVYQYGRGRIDHFFVAPRFFNPIFLIPLAFLVYLLTLPLLVFYNPMTILPLVAYAALVLAASATASDREHALAAFLLRLGIFPLMHLAYALGTAQKLAENLLAGMRLPVMPIHTTKIKTFSSTSWTMDERAAPVDRPLVAGWR